MSGQPTSTKEIGALRILARGTTKRCPVCGERDIFEGWFSLRKSCPRCWFVFERQEGQFIGAVGVNTSITFGALTLVMVLGFVLTAPDFNAALILGSCLAVATLLPLIFFPVSKTLWAAIDLLLIPLEPGEAPFRG